MRMLDIAEMRTRVHQKKQEHQSLNSPLRHLHKVLRFILSKLKIRFYPKHFSTSLIHPISIAQINAGVRARMEITAIASKINAIIINTMMIFFFISDIAVPSLNSTLSGPARQATETTLPSPMQSRRAAAAFPIPIWNSALWMQTQAMISKYISGIS